MAAMFGMGGSSEGKHTERVKVADLKRLIRMGYERDACIQALIYSGHDVQRAAEYLIRLYGGR